MHKIRLIDELTLNPKRILEKPLLLFTLCLLFITFSCLIIFIQSNSVFAQTIDDPEGDVPAGDPDYVDMYKVKFWQSKGAPENMSIDFYSQGPIPKGNQAGINATAIFEVYMDVDDDSTTGVPLDDIGYDYKLYVNLYEWNGKNWINGTVYWDYDAFGLSHSLSGFFTFAEGNPRATEPYRFRWQFSLISLKWSKVKWIARTFYNNHWSDQVPDQGHATLEVDTSEVADIDTVRGEHIEFIYPSTYQEVLDKYDVIKAIDFGTKVQSQLCGTEFHGIQTIQYNPWMNGVAACGNPVDMGSWMWHDEPPWFVVFHELGHNYTLASQRFNQLYPGLGYISMGGDDWNFGMNFVEAWATMAGLYAMQDLFTKTTQYQLSSDCAQNLEQLFNDTESSYRGALSIYEQNPDFSKIYPDVLDGIFLTLAETHGYGIFPKFFEILQPPDQRWDTLNEIKPEQDYDRAKALSMTVTCCAFSVAGGVDLRDQFENQWDLPIDDPFYEQIKPTIEGMITDVDDVLSLGEMRFQLFPNYPNPFNASTVLSYQLWKSSPVKVKVYNLLGQLVTVLNEGLKDAGTHHLLWDASDFPSGIYVFYLETNQGVKSMTCTVLQ